MTATHVIVGAGEAGMHTALTLRELGHEGPVTLVGGEPLPPYQRPPLSKKYLTGEVETDELTLRAPEFLAEQGIQLRTGRRVVDAAMHDAGGVAMLDDGTELRFDGLALATGSRPRTIEVPGSELDGILMLRTLRDAEVLRDALTTATKVVVVGGGFIGLEVAATARAQRKVVTVIEAADRLLPRVVAEPVSAHVLDFHRGEGIEVLLGCAVSAFHGDAGRATGVELGDGRLIPADLVVIGIGSVPEVGLARDLGLACERGIVVDERARTSHPSVVAAGDCTSQPHWHAADRRHVLESVNNAVEQGKIAAHTLLGLEPTARTAPWFWSDQASLKLQIVGISDGYDFLVVRGDGADRRLTVLYYRRGCLIAVDAINHPKDYMAAKKALGCGLTIDPQQAGDVNIPLKTLVSPADARRT